MLYATCEIILVVIGILIALLINGWNQDLQERKKELNYLKEIKSNLKSDSLNLRQVMENNERKQQIYDTILRSYDINNPHKNLNIYVVNKYTLLLNLKCIISIPLHLII